MAESNYRRPTTRQIELLKMKLPIIMDVSQYVSEKLIGKEIHIFTENQHIKLNFKRASLLHLLGFDYRGGNRQFWRDIQKNRFSVRNIASISDYAFDKITALQILPELFEKESRLAEGFYFERVRTDKSLRTNKLILILGLTQERTNDFYFPQSALNMKQSNKSFSSGKPVLAIYTKDKETKEIKILQQKEGYKINFEKVSSAPKISIKTATEVFDIPFQKE